MRSLKENFLWNASYQILRIITPLITMPYLSRVLGAEQLGTFSYTYSVATWFSLFCLLGLNQYGNREIARVRDDTQKLSKTFWSIYAMQLATTAVVSIVYTIYALNNGEFITYSLVWVFWIVSEAININWLFFGLEEFRITVIRNFVVRIATIILIFALVHNEGDLWVYCAIQSISMAVSYLVLVPFLRNRVNFYRPHLSEIAVHIKPNIRLFAPIVAISFYTQLDKVLLGNLSASIAQVSFYDYSEKISQIPLSVVQALGIAMLPRMSSVISKGQTEKAREYLDVSIWFASIMSLGFMFGVMAISQEFIPIFLGAEYMPCIALTMAISGMIPLIAWSNAIGVQYLLPMGEDRKYTLSVILGAVINVISNIILIPHMQAMGAVISTLISEAAVTIMQCAFVRKDLPLAKYAYDAIPYMIMGLVMFATVRVSSSALGAFGIIGLLLEVLLGASVYAVLGFLWLRLRRDDRLEVLLKKW